MNVDISGGSGIMSDKNHFQIHFQIHFHRNRTGIVLFFYCQIIRSNK